MCERKEGEMESRPKREEREMRWRGSVNDEDSLRGDGAGHHSRGMEMRRR